MGRVLLIGGVALMMALGGLAPGLPGAIVAAQEASPGAAGPTIDIPAPEECQVEPRSFASMQALATPGAVSAPPVTSGTPGALPPGQPADAETTAAITATMREIIACFNAGSPLRSFALYSDGLLRPLFGSPAPLSAAVYAQFSTPTPVAPDLWVGIVEIRDARILDDGRAAAIVITNDPAAPSDQPTNVASLLVFVRAGDRWLLDNAVEDQALLTIGTPTP